MFRVRSLREWHGYIIPLSLGVAATWVLLIAVTCLTPHPSSAQSQQITGAERITQTKPKTPLHTLSELPDDSPPTRNGSPQPPGAKQNQTIMRERFEKSKNDAAEMATLAKDLRKELNKPNANALSLEVANLADRIEKLAKKIRREARGF